MFFLKAYMVNDEITLQGFYMITKLNEQQSKSVIGGNNYYFKCWTSKGKEYWDTQPNNAGCTDSRTGQTVKGSAPQRKK